MTYKELFPKVVERDCKVIQGKTVSDSFRDATIEALLEDAFRRGKTYGVDSVLSDPGSFDLFAHDERD